MYQNGIQNLFSKLIETNFDQKLPWHFSNNIWTTFVVQCNSMELKQHKLKLHGILAWSKVPWNFFHTPEFHGIPCNFKFHKKFHGISWSSMERFWSSIEFHRNWWNWYKNIIFIDIVFGIRLVVMCYLAKISQICYIFYWFQYHNSYFEHSSVSENGASTAKMATKMIVQQWKSFTLT